MNEKLISISLSVATLAIGILLAGKALAGDFDSNKCTEKLGEDKDGVVVGKHVDMFINGHKNFLPMRHIVYEGQQGEVFTMNPKCDMAVLYNKDGIITRAHASEGCCKNDKVEPKK